METINSLQFSSSINVPPKCLTNSMQLFAWLHEERKTKENGYKGVTLLQCNKHFQRKKNNEKDTEHNFLKYQTNKKMRKKNNNRQRQNHKNNLSNVVKKQKQGGKKQTKETKNHEYIVKCTTRNRRRNTTINK